MDKLNNKTAAKCLIITGGILLVSALFLGMAPKPVRTAANILYSARGFLLLAGVALLIFGICRYPTARHRTLIHILFLLPAGAAFFLTVVIPFFLGIYYSMTDWDGVTMKHFVGLANYGNFFRAPEYIYALLATVIFTILNVVLVNVIAVLLALLVTSGIKGQNLYRTGFFVPNLIGGIVLGYIWQFIFNYVFTSIAGRLGLEALSQSLLVNPKLGLLSIVIVSTWQYAGYIMMIYVTAIQGVPAAITEAAKMDGARGAARFFKITVPMIANSFTICIFLTLVNSFKQFDLNFAITNGGPGTLFMGKAVNATELLALNIYKTAFTRNNMAVAQSKAVVFFILLAIVSLLQVSANKKKEVEL